MDRQLSRQLLRHVRRELASSGYWFLQFALQWAATGACNEQTKEA